jgi:hypothetical protein
MRNMRMSCVVAGGRGVEAEIDGADRHRIGRFVVGVVGWVHVEGQRRVCVRLGARIERAKDKGRD